MADATDARLRSQQVATPRAQATSGLPAATPHPGPFTGRRIVLLPNNDFAADSFLQVQIMDPARRPLAVAAFTRLVGTKTGVALLNALSKSFFDPQRGQYTVFVIVRFDATTQSGVQQECGHVDPPAGPGQPYTLVMQNYVYGGPPVVWPGDPTNGKPAALRGQTIWPPDASGAWCEMRIYYPDDAAAMMAECLYHELLHVWFLEDARHQPNAAPRTYPTGHGDQTKCEMEALFHQGIKAIVDELNAPYLAKRPPLPGHFIK